jgi:hypothetical protein
MHNADAAKRILLLCAAMAINAQTALLAKPGNVRQFANGVAC